tara:strand:+ start:350 stop:736 length:387 start_codon:yes stop_codon:yes gene_type:complete
MANGTIAFDTLTTSDSANTGTEKSIDTSYLLNGSCKAWYDLDETGTAVIDDSFNCGSLTDNGTGAFNIAWTNSMSNTTYASLFGGVSQSDIGTTAVATGSHTILTRQGFDGTSIDLDPIYSGIFGDLA